MKRTCIFVWVLVHKQLINFRSQQKRGHQQIVFQIQIPVKAHLENNGGMFLVVLVVDTEIRDRKLFSLQTQRRCVRRLIYHSASTENNLVDNQLDIVRVKKELMGSIDAINQSRSNYQIERFVVGEHATVERQFMQCVLELQTKLSNIKKGRIQLRKLNKKLASEQDDDEKELISIDIEDLELSLKSQMREAGTLYAIYTSMPKFTYQELQQAEEKYWTLRLAKQAQLDVESTGRISVGNLDALRMAGIVEDSFAQHFLNPPQKPKELK